MLLVASRPKQLPLTAMVAQWTKPFTAREITGEVSKVEAIHKNAAAAVWKLPDMQQMLSPQY
jgi:hypothetical protein